MGLFKTYSEKEVKRVMPIVNKINSLEEEISKLSDEQLRNKTIEFKEELKNGKTLDDILPEAFAVVREASKRVLGMRHFDVQLIGGIILHQGRIAEMKTGEGKTLVATLPVYLNALTGKGVHVITVNDYLAKRDSEWMGKLYKFLGLTVGLIIFGMDQEEIDNAYMNLVYEESKTTGNTDKNKATNIEDINALPDKYIIYSKMAALEQRIYKRLETFEDRLITTLDYAIKKWAQN